MAFPRFPRRSVGARRGTEHLWRDSGQMDRRVCVCVCVDVAGTWLCACVCCVHEHALWVWGVDLKVIPTSLCTEQRPGNENDGCALAGAHQRALVYSEQEGVCRAAEIIH